MLDDEMNNEMSDGEKKRSFRRHKTAFSKNPRTVFITINSVHCTSQQLWGNFSFAKLARISYCRCSSPTTTCTDLRSQASMWHLSRTKKCFFKSKRPLALNYESTVCRNNGMLLIVQHHTNS